MIYGIGTDIVEIARIQKLYEQYGDRFVKRILSEAEQDLFAFHHYSTAFLAKRFAGKEAVAKALGTGIGESLAFTEISITNEQSGKPIVTLEGKAKNRLTELSIRELSISLSDEKSYALAFVIATKSL
ncbi:MAG: holo-ACP synthase [Candidatus Berkiella sp.]